MLMGSHQPGGQLLSEDEQGLPSYSLAIDGTAGNQTTKPILQAICSN